MTYVLDLLKTELNFRRFEREACCLERFERGFQQGETSKLINRLWSRVCKS